MNLWREVLPGVYEGLRVRLVDDAYTPAGWYWRGTWRRQNWTRERRRYRAGVRFRCARG